jgi:CPA1 family monovalent cation:H+ antiporter
MVAGNIKGALSMAAVLALPAGFVLRDRLVAIVFGVTFVTLVVQALPFAWLLRVLRVSLSAGTESIDAARATLITARRGQTELDELMSAGLVSRKQHAEWRAALQRQLIDAERELRVRTQGTRDHGVQVSVLTAQKAALLDAVRKGLLGSEAAEAAVSDLDRRLMALEVTEDP